jgi:hypothetical protein
VAISDARQVDPFTTDPNVPAPIFADPSVPDPVPGESSPPSPLITDCHNASGLLSIDPPAVRRVIDHDPSQISSGISGLFTPAQRSEGGTPIQLEDEAADALTNLQNGTDKDLEVTSISSPTGRFITRDEYGGDVNDKDAMGVNEQPQLASPDEHQFRIGPADAGTRNPASVIESADEISPPTPTGHGSAKADVTHSGGLDLDRECVIRTPIIADVDEDADGDGEADPDYSTLSTDTFHPKPAHQPVDEGREVASSKTSNDVLEPKVTASGLENLPMR